MNIYVGNLSYDTTEDGLRQAFEVHGRVEAVRVIVDKYTNRTRGFGFVEMAEDAEGRAAIAALDGGSLDGRTIKVNEARPREDRN